MRHLSSAATAVAAVLSGDDTGAVSNAASDDVTRLEVNPEEQMAQAELLDLIHRGLDELPAVEATVVRAFYFEEKSFSEIAESLDLSKSWTCRLHAEAMARLTKRVKSTV